MDRPMISADDFVEQGKSSAGELIQTDQRLFMQLLVFSHCKDPKQVIAALQNIGAKAVVYADANDPQGIGVLTMSTDPDFFVTELRQMLNKNALQDLVYKPKLTMFGRSYSIGYEPDLDYCLIKKPLERALNPQLSWVIWYPLRRSGAFEALSKDEQSRILMEHSKIGIGASKLGYVKDIRLACHGLDTNDSDFVIAVLGEKLAPLSKIIQRMRRTEQTSKYLERLGPFFIGKVIWQSNLEAIND